jgi:protein phosphatase
MALAAHGVTHVGRRPTNEDSMLVDLSLGLFVVADGMGGHNAGEVASAIAVRALQEFVRQTAVPLESSLAEALSLANEEVFHAASTRAEYDGMGTTVVAALVDADRVVFGSVGDSRIYRWHDGTLTQLTRDDSWVSRVLPEEIMSAEDAQRHPMRHVLTKVVGLREELEPAVGTSPFLPGDLLVMCSDGLHGSLADAEIAGDVTIAGDVADIAQRLVDHALAGGASDNVTVVVVRRE